jgi:23S rRNA (uridine2552-2'-O)-methyltransferase
MSKQQQKQKQHHSQTKRPGDFYYSEAKQQGFVARSVFKLQEIDQKYRLFSHSGEKPFFVMDLGCAPGSWLQYVLPKLKQSAKILGIDLNKINIKDDKLVFMQRDITEVTNQEFMDAVGSIDGYDVVLSDMAPKTCGIKLVDQERSLDLCREAARVSRGVLKKNGTLVIKVFQGPDVKKFTDELKHDFSEVKMFKPDSSRTHSFEIYIVATGRSL